MEKRKEVVKSTTNSKEYKRAKGSIITKCNLCSPNKGCNKWGKRSSRKNWKRHRKYQWRI